MKNFMSILTLFSLSLFFYSPEAFTQEPREEGTHCGTVSDITISHDSRIWINIDLPNKKDGVAYGYSVERIKYGTPKIVYDLAKLALANDLKFCFEVIRVDRGFKTTSWHVQAKTSATK